MRLFTIAEINLSSLSITRLRYYQINVIFLNFRPDWATAKLILGDTHFLERLQEYDKNNIPEKTLMKLKPYIKHKDFKPEIVIKVSKVSF